MITFAKKTLVPLNLTFSEIYERVLDMTCCTEIKIFTAKTAHNVSYKTLLFQKQKIKISKFPVWNPQNQIRHHSAFLRWICLSTNLPRFSTSLIFSRSQKSHFDTSMNSEQTILIILAEWRFLVRVVNSGTANITTCSQRRKSEHKWKQ